jgi:hypothetical protein
MLPLSLCVQAQETFRKRRTTTMGREVLIDTHSRHRIDCSSAGAPLFTLTQPPEHGSVDVREGQVIAKPTAVGTGDCTGTPIRGILVYYTPADGYAGKDAFTYDLRLGTHPPLHHDVVVDVEPPPAASAPR